MPDAEPDREADRRGAKPGEFGNRPFEATEPQREFVRVAAGCGMPQASIARHLQVSEDTLQRHFRQELDLAADEANVKVAGTMFRMATDPNHKDSQRAGQFWLMARAGWRTREDRRHSFGLGDDADAAPDADQVLPRKITVEFVGRRPKGLPGAAPDDQ